MSLFEDRWMLGSTGRNQGEEVTRNVFENNGPVPDEEDIKAVGDGPHILLPPLTEGHVYAIADLPSGGKAVVVRETHKENTELERAFPDLNSPESRTLRHRDV